MPVPFRQPGPMSLVHSLANVAVGSSAVIEFVASREEAVPDGVANVRAATCAACALNTKGNWLSRFTVPVANAIRVRLQDRRSMNLSTPQDAELGVCEACECPLPLMIHFPLAIKLKHLTAKARANLDPACWVLREEAELQKQ